MTNFATGQDVIPAPYRSLSGVGLRGHRVDDSVLLRRLIIYKIQFALRSVFVVAGFVAFNMLAVLGAFVVFFVVLGQARPSGFFVHIREVSRRFLEATGERQADFLMVLSVVFIALFVLVSALRATVLRDRLFEGGSS
jgi:hypothetical protein